MLYPGDQHYPADMRNNSSLEVRKFSYLQDNVDLLDKASFSTVLGSYPHHIILSSSHHFGSTLHSIQIAA